MATLNAEIRTETGKGSARRLRTSGKTPGIVYGGKEKPVSLTIDSKELTHIYQKGSFLSRTIKLTVDGKTENVLPRDLQLHPVTDRIKHVDFLRLTDDKKVRVSVPVQFKNAERSPGIKRGGNLNIVRHEIELLCNATAIPTSIRIDLGNTGMGESIHVSQINLPEGAEPTITDRDFTIASITGRKLQEEAEEETEGEEGSESEGEDSEAPAAEGSDEASGGDE